MKTRSVILIVIMKLTMPLSGPVVCVAIIPVPVFSSRTKMRLSRKVIQLSSSFTFRQRGRTAGAVKLQRLKMRMKGMDKEYLCQSVSEDIFLKGSLIQ